MEFLLWAALVGLIVFGLLAAIGYAITNLVIKGNVRRARAQLGPLGPHDYEESAVMVEGGQGFGVLRLTPAELKFGNAATAGLVRMPLELLTWVGKDSEPGGSAGQRPDPVLVVAIGSADQMTRTAFAVGRVDEWVARITKGRAAMRPTDPQPNDPQPNDPQPNDPQPNDPQPNDADAQAIRKPGCAPGRLLRDP